MITRWIAFWSREEHPRSLALVRLLVGLVFVVELVEIGRLGLIEPLFASQQAGGWTELSGSLLGALGPQTTYGLLLGASFGLMLGLFSRTSALILLLLWARFGAAVPFANRAVDVLARDVLCILALSGAGGWASLDAWWRTGSWWGDGGRIGAWARYLVIAQLIVLYFVAGLQKTDPSWWPWGGCTALFVVLQDPAVTRMDFGWLRQGGWRFTQAMTLITVLWQLGYPLILLTFRSRLHWLWVGVGLLFHGMLAATMELGLFPWYMMALYPALIAPPTGRPDGKAPPAARRKHR